MPVYKIHIALTVMLEADSEPAALAEIGKRPLAAIGHEIDEGDWIGQSRIEESEEVTPGNLHDELVLLGNDGTFFWEIR